MTVWAELDGHPFDLQALARNFPTGDPRVVQDDEGITFMVTDTLDDVLCDGTRVVEAADDQLVLLNGYATLVDPGYRPARLNRKFHREAEPDVRHLFGGDEARGSEGITVVATATAETRAGVLATAVATTDGVAVAPPPPLGPGLLARGNQDLNDLLAIVGKAERLSWSQLYKAFEIIRDAVGREGLYDNGWTTKRELSTFTGSAACGMATPRP